MTDALGTFLAGTSRRPLQYGEWDCLLRLADWGLAVSGRDAGEGWRGRCRTHLGAMRILKRHGGIEAVLDVAFVAIGWRRTEAPGRGSVAIVEATEGVTGAILLGRMRDGQALASQLAVSGGIIVRRLPVIAAWEFG